MSNIPISSLPVATSLDGSEYVPIVQSGTTKRVTTADIGNTASDFVLLTTAVNAGIGLSGGGQLNTDITLNFAPIELTPKTAPVVADSVVLTDSANSDEPVRSTISNFYKTIDGLPSISIPNLASDEMVIIKASDGLAYKITPSGLSLATGNVPAGGLTGQVLTKLSNTDYDSDWAEPYINLNANSIAANPTGATAPATSVTLGATLSFSGSSLRTGAGTGDVSWSANSFTTSIGNNKVTDAMLRQSSGLSILGRSASTTGNVADITGTADQVLRVAAAGASAGFGSIDLSKSAAVGASILGPTNGGTGLASYALGDTLFASAANTLSALAGNTTTTRKFLRQTGSGAASAAPVWDTVTAADVPGSALTASNDTNVTLTLGGSPTTALLNAASVTAGWTGQLAVGRGGTGLSAGTSGGVPYFSSTSTMASSALLTQNALILGGGAGNSPVALGSLGTTTTVLHGNAAGAPTFAAVSLTADVSGTLPVANGGTGAANLNAFVLAGTTNTITVGYTFTANNIGTVSSGTTTPAPASGNYQFLTNNGAFTLAAPSSDCAIDVLVTNGASAGSITFSGFTVGANTGSTLTTTNTNKFLVSIRRINSVSTYSIYALQ